jgi:oligopeptide transport system substrate-binding protein
MMNESRVARKVYLTLLTVCVVALLAGGCGKRETLAAIGDRTQELRLNNEGEPASLDPAVEIGNIEHSVILALFEGLITADPKDLSPRPGVAESWKISPDGKVYTFHLRKNGRWSNGEPVTARDFVQTYHRMLTPSLGAQYSYMLYPVKNAEAFNLGKITDFSRVGFKALDDYTLELTLHSPAPYLLSMMIHDSWFPVPIAVIKKHGALDDRTNPWTKPENFVGNGPFVLKEWRMNSHILVERSPTYWDATNVRLNKIYFDPTESLDTAERMFRSGQLHSDPQAPPSKVAFYRKYKPNLINVYPLLGTYFYKIHVTQPALKDKRVRQALAMTIDRHAMTETIMRAGEEPAYFLTPPNTAGYTCQTKVREDAAEARQLLAEAGYPDGKNFPTVEVLFNTGVQYHKAIAEALQEMWKKNLNINIVLHNEEWKVYLDSLRRMDYSIGRASWVGDYVDPSTFLDMFTTENGNNETGWSNAEYDRLVHLASNTGDRAARYDAYQKAEAILLDEMPIIPIYFYTRPRLIQPSVRGWYPNVIDQYDFKSIYLVPEDN